MFSIIDLENQFSKQKLNKAKKLVVRELEEEKKNRFVCFIDENEESFDVQIQLSAKSEITDSSCDCESGDFCLHKLALAIHLSEKKSGKTPNRAKAKKISETELAMENLNSEEMKLWLLEFFKKNKDAEMQFLLEFGEKKTDFSDEEIRNIIGKTIQSVIGKKKNITAPEVKKIVDLLTKSLQPVEEFLWKNITKPVSLEKFVFVNEQLMNFQMNIYTTSNRIDKFLEKLKEKFALQFNQIQDEEVWGNLATKNWNFFLKGEGQIPFYQYDLLLEIYHSGNPKQKLSIAELIKNTIEIWIKNNVHIRTEIREDLLEIMIDSNFYTSTKAFFPILRYENSYNLRILNELRKTDKQKTEEYCKAIIESNSNGKYNYPYFEILEKIYTEENNFPKMAYIKRKNFDNKPNIEDYIFIEKNEEDKGEFKKFRNNSLANLRRSFYGNPENKELYFDILESEKNYKKMLEVIDESIPSSIINKFSEKLYLFDKTQFLSKMQSRTSWISEEIDNEKLADFLVSKYDAQELKFFFEKNIFGFGSVKFSGLVLRKLK